MAKGILKIIIKLRIGDEEIVLGYLGLIRERRECQSQGDIRMEAEVREERGVRVFKQCHQKAFSISQFCFFCLAFPKSLSTCRILS